MLIPYADTTVRFESIKIMLAEAASKDLETAQMDVTTAFLYVELDEEVYSEIPEGMFGEEDMSRKVLLLLKAIFGLKQSSRMWNLHIDKVLGEFGLEKYTSDVLQKFNMSDCRSATTPLPPASKLSSSDSPTTGEEKQRMDLLPYRSAIGSLMYLGACTKPDIASTISSLSRFNANPGQAH